MDIEITLKERTIKESEAKKLMEAIETLKRSQAVEYAGDIETYFKDIPASERTIVSGGFKNDGAVHDLKLTLLAIRDLLKILQIKS